MKTEINFSENIKKSLTVKKQGHKVGDYLLMKGFDEAKLKSLPEAVVATPVAPSLAGEIDLSGGCVSFNFELYENINVFGNLCANGTVDLTINAYGVTVELANMNIGEQGICNTSKVSDFLTIKICFNIKGNCLYSSGKVTTPFGDLGAWNDEIACL